MTHTQKLREVGKFAAGLVAGDLLTGLWLLTSQSFPQSFFGAMITQEIAWLWVGFDLFILLTLIHYSWNPQSLEPRTSSKSLFLVVGMITGIIAIVHFFRLVFGWSVVVAGWTAPMWISGLGIVVATYISYTSFHFAAKHRRR